MNRLKIIITTERDDMKPYFAALLKEMAEHEEIKSSIILEEKEVKE